MNIASDHLPIVPLGILEDWFFLIDGMGNHIAMLPHEFTPKKMLELVPQSRDAIFRKFPKRPGQRNAYDADGFRGYLFAICAIKGVTDPWEIGFLLKKRGRVYRWIWLNA